MPETFLDGRIQLWPGDCIDSLARLAINSVDACVCDPPYHFTSIVKRFGSERAAPAQYGKDGAYARASAGFMGQQWDGGDVAFRPETWVEVLRVLKPGAHLLAFGGTRTYHRMVCAIEDAGFEIRDCIQWLYGQGFPKSHDVSKGIDRSLGKEGSYGDFKSGEHDRTWRRESHHEGWARPWMDDPEANDRYSRQYIAGSDAAKQWQGWGTALKPACELIVLARKPLSEKTVAANVLKWNVGALNIDETRIHANSKSNPSGGKGESGSRCPIHGVRGVRQDNAPMEESGRPSKMADDVWQEVSGGEDEGVGQSELDKRLLVRQQDGLQTTSDEQTSRIGFAIAAESETTRLSGTSDGDGSAPKSGITTARERTSHQRQQDRQSDRKSSADRLGGSRSGTHEDRAHDDSAQGRKREIEVGEQTASGCTCGKSLGRWPANLIHDGSEEVLAGFPQTGVSSGGNGEASQKTALAGHNGDYSGATLGQNAGGLGDTGSAARFFYTPKADSDDRIGSKHPTVKPVDLMRYLVRLVTPPNGTVLDPFAGTGTTGEAAFCEGRRAILMERETEYQDDIRRRMRLVLAGPDERQREGVKAKLKDKPANPGPLFSGLAEDGNRA